MRSLIDHLWQSMLVLLLISALCALLAPNSATLRLWLWRVAALKFLAPFSALYGLGGWIGFPVRHSAIPPPAGLREAVASATPWVAPLHAYAPGGFALMGCVLLAVGLTTLCAGVLLHQLRVTAAQRAKELARQQADAWWQPASPGMFKSTTLAVAAFCALVAPVLAGALHDRVTRQAALAIDIESLRAARVSAVEAAWTFGDRPEIHAIAGGVSIRKINLQDLVALVYGIDEFEVFGGALPWLESPHYDIEITGPLHAPAVFDPYSLRQPVTQYLYDQYGVSIRVNGDCQEPCLNQESFVIERIPWTLSKMITGRK